MSDLALAHIVEDGLELRVYVQPGAKNSAIIGVRESGDGLRLKIKLQARAIEGLANKALLELIAEQMQLTKSAVTLLAGSTARLKTVHMQGNGKDLLNKLERLRAQTDN